VLLRALAWLRARGRELRLDIVGEGPDRALLEMLALELGLAAQVVWHGALANGRLPAMYRQATALVAPFVVAPDGDREGLGLVVVEAMGCGCPVVTTSLAEI